MKIDLSDLKVGDKVFSSLWGVCHTTSIDKYAQYSIEINKNVSCTIDGKFYDKQEHPTLFHSLKECQDYWASVNKYVNKIEAQEAFKSGKRVRYTGWGEKYYISLSNVDIIYFEVAIKDLFDNLSECNEWDILD